MRAVPEDFHFRRLTPQENTRIFIAEAHMLSIENLSWSVPGGTTVLDHIRMDVPDGNLTVVTGPNGGGKTSLAKIIAGLETPQTGKILLDGEDILPLDITQRAQKGICYAFQTPVRFKGITVRDMLNLAAGRTLSWDESCRLLHLVGLCAQDYLDRGTDASLSGGESKRIEIAGILARHNPRVMVFDEPEAGIDLWSFTGLLDIFRHLKQRKDLALLVISHQERILEIADRITVIAGGRIRREGNGPEILAELLHDEKSVICPLGKEAGGSFPGIAGGIHD